MRVKIAYSIELEEVESEVKEIMNRALNHAEEASKDAFEATSLLDTDKSDILSIAKQLDSARRSLAKADIIISDCQEILMGYHATLQKAQEEAENEEV